MGDGTQIQQAGDGKGKSGHDPDVTRLSDSAMAKLSASIYGDPSKQNDAPGNTKRLGNIPLSVADQPVGPAGGYGAPAIPGQDVITRPNQRGAAPSGPTPYDFGDTGTPSSAPVPIHDYDLYGKIGGSSFDNYPDYAARMASTAGALYITGKRYFPTLTKGFEYTVPPFHEANGVAAATINDLAKTRIPAHMFLKAEHARLASLARGLSPDPDRNTEPENELISQVKRVRNLRDMTTKELMEGDNPIRKVDFSGLSADTKNQRAFITVTNLEKAQDTLITERLATVEKLKADAKTAFLAEKGTAKKELGLNFGAVLGAQVVDYAIDQISPRNRIGWETTVTDLVAPLAATAFSMSKIGKWAPLTRFGIIVGAHTVSHLIFDEQIDEKK